MRNMRFLFNFKSLLFFSGLILSLTFPGCIRMQAGYYTNSGKERKERTVALDTGKLIEGKQEKGSITA